VSAKRVEIWPRPNPNDQGKLIDRRRGSAEAYQNASRKERPPVREWLESVGDLPPVWIYLVAAVLVVAETGLVIGLFLPGEPVLLFVGFLTSVGTLDFGPATILLVAAALTGDSMAYALGRRYGPRVRAGPVGRWVGERRWQRSEELLDRYGGRAVFLGRWVAFARTLVPSLAGMSGLRYPRFLAWDVAAVATYVPGSVLLGYIAGRSYAELERTLGRATGAVTLLAFGVAGLVVAGRWLGRHPDPAHALGRYLGQLPPVRWAWSRVDWFSSRLSAAGARAVNVAFGLAAMFLVGWGVAELTQRVVRTSGLPLVDGLVVRWIAARPDPDVTEAAQFVVTTLSGSVALIVVGLVTAVVAFRARRRGAAHWSAPVGAFASLVILGLTVHRTLPETTPPAGAPSDAFFPTGHVVVTASVGLLAWMASRRASWSRAVAAWTAAAVTVLLVTVARLYLGGNWPSEAAASVLLGVVWDAVLIATWRSWERTPVPQTEEEPAPAHSHATPSPSRSRPAR
jgi:membrane protein DedA with SNARE-associated domain/membrane-associated phospholipid phosphatase